MEEKRIASISELISTLAKDITTDERPVWFRGHGISTWRLRPTIFRITSKKKEIDYLKEFKVNANLLIEPRPKDDYEWLFIMGHHYVPTRLIDWTEPVSRYLLRPRRKI